MVKYLGNTGLSRLWTKYKQKYVLKSDELGTGNPNSTYTYSESSTYATNITVDIITSHVGSNDTLSCVLSQPVDVNLLFKINLDTTYELVEVATGLFKQ